ncbi:MAG: hypothetical protein KDK28_19215, partial [Maritimibacter sp.]|nr:hypothetical protein [Maritimibacter sp.]
AERPGSRSSTPGNRCGPDGESQLKSHRNGNNHGQRNELLPEQAKSRPSEVAEVTPFGQSAP